MSTLSEATAPAPHSPTVAARAIDAVKIYGKDDNEVRALDGVTIEFATGVFTAIIPLSSGKSTLMHRCAGPTPSRPARCGSASGRSAA